MKGELVPVVMIPRYTSFVGEGSYITTPLLVSDFADGTLELWTGFIYPAAGASFTVYFEEAFDAELPTSGWISCTSISPPTTQNSQVYVPLAFSKRYFRIRIVLTPDSTYGLVAITCWAAGSFQKRIPDMPS
jgi:hypothetical protein